MPPNTGELMGLSVFLHSVRMVFNNLAIALRISAPLIAVVALSAAGAFVVANAGSIQIDGRQFFVLFLLWLAIALICLVWVAVAWHRFVLMDEVPDGLLPELRGGRIFAYSYNALVIAVLLFLASLPLDFLVNRAIEASAGALMIIIAAQIASAIVVAAISYRVSLMLPGAAIGNLLSIRQSWQATKGKGFQLLVLAVVSVASAFVVDLPVLLVQQTQVGLMLGFLWGAITAWFKVMIGFSILTTLYGHLIQGRPLSGSVHPA